MIFTKGVFNLISHCIDHILINDMNDFFKKILKKIMFLFITKNEKRLFFNKNHVSHLSGDLIIIKLH